MDYYCEVYDKYMKHKSENRHFKSTIHKEFDRCKHIKLTIENPNINNVDEVSYAYNIEQYRKN